MYNQRDVKEKSQLSSHMSSHLVCDVVVSKFQDVPCQVAHGVQSHGAVLKEMSACGEEKFHSGASLDSIDCHCLTPNMKLSVTILLEI